MNEWKAEHLRITLFLAAACPFPKDILMPMFGVEVESFAQKSFGAESVAQGVWHSVRVEVRANANRLDLIILPPSNENVQADSVPNWGSLINPFIDCVSKWIVLSEIVVIRAAVSTVGQLPVNSRDAGYDKFAELVKPVVMRKDEFSDITFQVNIRKNSTVIPDLFLNRLSAWAVAFAKFVMILPGGGTSQSDPTHSLRCMVDINTDGDSTEPLNKSLLKDLLLEMSVEMLKIQERGVE